jgi:hypothetical protein
VIAIRAFVVETSMSSSQCAHNHQLAFPEITILEMWFGLISPFQIPWPSSSWKTYRFLVRTAVEQWSERAFPLTSRVCQRYVHLTLAV